MAAKHPRDKRPAANSGNTSNVRKPHIPGGDAVPDRAPTREVKRPPDPAGERPTGPRPPSPGSRATSMMSLEPPKRGPSLAPGARMDGMAARQGRNPTQGGSISLGGGQRPQRPTSRTQGSNAPHDRKPTGPYTMGGSGEYDPSALLFRRKGTRRVPKADGSGIEGDIRHALDSRSRSDRLPAVEPGAAERRSLTRRPSAPNPPSAGNTLTGVRAEDLLGDEGRELMRKVRRHEAEVRKTGPQPATGEESGLFRSPEARPPAQPHYPPPAPPPPAGPVAPIPVGYRSGTPAAPATPAEGWANTWGAPAAEEPQAPSAPQQPADAPNYFAGDVWGGGAPPGAPTETPPSDDLGYEQPVDLGVSGNTDVKAREAVAGRRAVVEDEVEDEDFDDTRVVARESRTHDEMEQRVGYLLWLQGVITTEEIQDAVASAEEEEIRPEIVELIEQSGFTDQETLYRFLARHESLCGVDLESIEPSSLALAALRPAVARAYRAIPMAVLGKVLLVAAALPFEPKRLLELRSLTGKKIKLFIASEEEIDAALARYYPGGVPRSSRRAAVAATHDEPDEDAAEEMEEVEGASEEHYDPTMESGEEAVSEWEEAMQAAGVSPGWTEDAGDSDEPHETVDGPNASAASSTGPAATEIGEAGDLDESTLGEDGEPASGDAPYRGGDYAGFPEESEAGEGVVEEEAAGEEAEEETQEESPGDDDPTGPEIAAGAEVDHEAAIVSSTAGGEGDPFSDVDDAAAHAGEEVGDSVAEEPSAEEEAAEEEVEFDDSSAPQDDSAQGGGKTKSSPDYTALSKALDWRDSGVPPTRKDAAKAPKDGQDDESADGADGVEEFDPFAD